MPFNITNIKSNLTLGGARPTLFQVLITNPVNPAGDFKTPFMVKTAEIPAFTVGPINVPYMGRVIKEAGDRTFADWTVTVINDEDFLIRNAMESWQGSINRLRRNLRDAPSSSALNYKSQATVQQFSKTGDVIREYQFEGIFPTEISNIGLAWDSTDTIEEFTVTFAYDSFEVLPGPTGDAGGA